MREFKNRIASLPDKFMCTPEALAKLVDEEVAARGRTGKAPRDIQYLDDAKKALANAKAVLQDGYYSQVRFQATGVVGTYNVAAGDRQAFSYAQGQDMASAGFPAGTLATLSNTNLSEANKTRAGDTYFIHGISVELSSTSEIAIASNVWANANVEISFNGGRNSMPVGRLEFFGRINGRWSTRLIPPALQSNTETLSIGESATPDNDQIYYFDPPLVWQKSGEVDSQLAIIVNLPTAFTIPAAARVGVPDSTTDYDPPDPDLVFADFTFRLLGESITKLSING